MRTYTKNVPITPEPCARLILICLGIHQPEFELIVRFVCLRALADGRLYQLPLSKSAAHVARIVVAEVGTCLQVGRVSLASAGRLSCASQSRKRNRDRRENGEGWRGVSPPCVLVVHIFPAAIYMPLERARGQSYPGNTGSSKCHTGRDSSRGAGPCGAHAAATASTHTS